MRHLSVHYKTHGKYPSNGDTLILGLESLQNISTEFLSLRPQLRDTSKISGIIHDPQKPTKIMETSIQTLIQAKNNITEKQRLLWLN